MPKVGRKDISKKTLLDAEKEMAGLATKFRELIAALDRKGESEFQAMNLPSYKSGVKDITKFIDTCTAKIGQL